MMQFLWKYVDDMVGKGLEISILMELLMYSAVQMVPLALPLAILISSIMTFGSLGEHYEIVAAKASGVSLLQLLQPMFVTSALICLFAFYFSNYILPIANLQQGALLYDVTHKKPALNIQENVFYKGIENYSIRVKSKAKDGQTLYGIIIYDHSDNMGNTKVMMADSGSMQMSTDGNILMVTLRNGSSYEELHQGRKGRYTRPMVRTQFAYEQVRFDLSEFALKRSDKELFKENKGMLNIWQLQNIMDSMKVEIEERHEAYLRSAGIYYTIISDSQNFYKAYPAAKAVNPELIVGPARMAQCKAQALTQTNIIKDIFNVLKIEYGMKKENIARYKIEWHRKFTLSIACIILFLIGAPLGAIIRKGGLGVPIIIAILFFLIFHVLSISGEKMAREMQSTALFGMWLSTLVLAPVGLFLIYLASKDSVIINSEVYKKAWNWMVSLFAKRNKTANPTT
ncbi:MAG: LptF/LptG family permease [Bacteroidetes bacterium]|nr:LptF/LptG family permease [Bacteroidota bacterium]